MVAWLTTPMTVPLNPQIENKQDVIVEFLMRNYMSCLDIDCKQLNFFMWNEKIQNVKLTKTSKNIAVILI